MQRSYLLSPEHYASAWDIPSESNTKHDRDAVNGLAIQYASLPDGAEKEALLLSLIKYFHGYLMKYVTMVVCGTIPSVGTPAGKDSLTFLQKLYKGESDIQDTQALLARCKMLHWVFKQMTSDDVYDIVVTCFVRATRHYDPYYTRKVRKVYEVLNDQFAGEQEFTAESISEAVDFDALRCLRMLVRKQFLTSIYDKKRKKVRAYSRGPAWPPSQKFLTENAIGFTYFVRRWFRDYLSYWIQGEMDVLENRHDFMQLDNIASAGSGVTNPGEVTNMGTPHTDGNITDDRGVAWAADTTLVNQQFDVSEMNDGWVRETTDRLFRKLTPKERKLLQMIYREDATLREVGDILDCTGETVKVHHDNILNYLRARSGLLAGDPDTVTDDPDVFDGPVAPREVTQ